MLPPALASVQADGGAERDLAERDDEHDAQQQAADGRQHALALDRLDDGVGRVDADQHQHEQEQHQDRAGVDDDLHREQERRLEDGVQDGEADHHDGEQHGGVHGLAHEQDAERGGHHDRGEDPEGHSAASCPGCGEVAAVVVALVVAEPHRVRRLLHAGQQRGEQVGLLVDQVRAVVVGQLVLVGHRERPGRAGLDAQAAQDAAQVVDLVDAAVALAGAEPARRSVFEAPST